MLKSNLLAILWVVLGLTVASAQNPTRTRIYGALLSGGILDPGRMLVHYSYTCNLNLGGALYPVIDVQELVKGAATPRGVNRIIILSPKWVPVAQIDYNQQRPLFCQDNHLYVYGDLTLNNTLPEGNVLTFREKGKTIKLSHVEANDYPIPATRLRQQPPQ